MGEAVMEFFEKGLIKRQEVRKRQEKIAAGTVINPAIDARLVTWGEWHQGLHEECGGCGSMLAALMAGKGEMIRSTVQGSDMPDDVYDTDRAVMSIEDKYRRVVFEQYQEVGSSPADRARAMGCAVATYYRWLAIAQSQVLFYLKAPVRKSPVRDAMIKNINGDKKLFTP